MKIQQLKQKLNYDKIVTGKDLDMKTYNQKFKMWDYVIEKGLFKKGDPKSIALLNDPTIYSYAFFRDDDGNPFRLTAYQDVIANCKHDLSDPNNPNRFIIFKASNQIGKSRELASLAIQFALTLKNVNIIMVSRSLPQSQFLLATIRHVLNNSMFSETWREDLGETANTTVLTFEKENGKIINRIICAPSGEGLLGYPVHYLFLDEADFYEAGSTFFWKVAFPRTNTTKGQIILFSNPNPDISRNASILWELWNGDLFQRKFTFNFLDAPWNTKQEYDVAKRNSPGYIFASTHDGEFPPDSGGFFLKSEIDDMMQKDWKNTLPVVDRPVYIGLDLAKMKDKSVLTLGVLTPNKENKKVSDLEIRYFLEFPSKTDYDIVIKRLKDIVEHYKKHHHGVASIGVDVSGVGRAVSDFCKSEGIKVTDVKFSLENKSRMYGNFKMLAEQRRIRMVHVLECEKQLSTLIFKRTPSGYLSVHHEKESLKDDYPDSVCALIDVSIIPSKIPVTMTIVDDGTNKQSDGKPSTQSEIDKYIARTIKANHPSNYGDDEYSYEREFMGGGI